MATRELMLDLNRVEGDLQVKLRIEDGVVTDAWTVGTMYRGFEQLMLGRAPMDSLVITPRVCGICGTAHLYAAVTALERALQCRIGPNGTRVRNACLMAEELQSDTRHAILMFAPDLCSPKYAGRPGHDAIVEAFEPFRGRVYREVVTETKKILEIVALWGGQWPHSSHMVPGGVVSLPSRRTIVKALAIVDTYTRWYERTMLGCSLDRWAQITTLDQLLAWQDERPEHAGSAIGRFLSFSRSLGLTALGRGTGNMLSYGVYFDPLTWQPPFGDQRTLRAAGFHEAATGTIHPFEQRHITEHVRHSWFEDHGGPGGAHPSVGETVPRYQPDSDRYTWAKAPRYDGQVIETGAFPELFMAGDPLIRALFAAEGLNVWTRQLARLHRPTLTLRALRRTLDDMAEHFDEPFHEPPADLASGSGHGLVMAARGALGHWVEFERGKITRYQLVTPTAWNASPRDSGDRRGHWEQSLIGTPVRDDDEPIELGHIIRSHDACLVCTVHFLDTGKRHSFRAA